MCNLFANKLLKKVAHGVVVFSGNDQPIRFFLRKYAQKLRKPKPILYRSSKPTITRNVTAQVTKLTGYMNYQDRILYQIQYFQGSIDSARLFLRAIALIWNFHPLSQKACAKYKERYSQCENINPFYYSYNWLENLLIAGSMKGYRPTT